MATSTFSESWKASTKARKQRLYHFNAPLHIKRKFLTVPLAKSLHAQYNKKRLPVRVGDSVKIVRGEFKGKKGKVERTDSSRESVFITGFERSKRDGIKQLIPFHPSNLLIESLVSSDVRRLSKSKKRLSLAGSKQSSTSKITIKSNSQGGSIDQQASKSGVSNSHVPVDSKAKVSSPVLDKKKGNPSLLSKSDGQSPSSKGGSKSVQKLRQPNQSNNKQTV